MTLRSIGLVVGSTPIGQAVTWAYPKGSKAKYYWIPTYGLEVTGTDDTHKSVKRSFEVLRFGVQQKTTTSAARVVGLANQQIHTIKRWISTYSVHSAASVEKGAWQVYDNFLIHDGPDDPKTEVYASIGCVEICNGPRGFDIFNNLLISLSGSVGRDRDAKLTDIGRSKKMTITYKKASRPKLVHY